MKLYECEMSWINDMQNSMVGVSKTIKKHWPSVQNLILIRWFTCITNKPVLLNIGGVGVGGWSRGRGVGVGGVESGGLESGGVGSGG